MKTKLLKLSATLLVLLFFYASANAQIIDIRGKRHLPIGFREKLIKIRIDEDKEDFNKLISRTETVSKLSKEIHASYEKNNALTPKDWSKLKELKKLLKKIRRKLSAKNDDKKMLNRKPKSLADAINKLRESTAFLLKEIRKTNRYSISVAVIQSSNTVWKLVKFIRLKKP